jgi:hypothetical protein
MLVQQVSTRPLPSSDALPRRRPRANTHDRPCRSCSCPSSSAQRTSFSFKPKPRHTCWTQHTLSGRTALATAARETPIWSSYGLNDGAGEQFFGENVEKPGERDAIEAARALGEDKAPGSGERLAWPGDGNKIIGLVTPLMRRMVTNERQRMYAIETRKGGAKKKYMEGSVEAQRVSSSPSGRRLQDENVDQPFVPAFDPTLGQTSQPTSPAVSTPVTPGQTPISNMVRLNRTIEAELLDSTNVPVSTASIYAI